MKVLFFSDIHGKKELMEKIIKKSKQADLLVCCGDLSNMGKNFDEMLEMLDSTNKKVLIIPGNNETPDFVVEGTEEYENIICIEEEIYQDLDIKFLGIGGGTISPFNTVYELSEEEFKEKLDNFSGINILVSHTPPKNTILDKTSSGLHIGSDSVRQWIEENEPKYCCCGHVHECAGKETMVNSTLCFNPGYEGRLIEL